MLGCDRMCPVCDEYSVDLERLTVDPTTSEAQCFSRDYNVTLTPEFILRFLQLIFTEELT